ncbi:MAG: prevent-host-death family protein [Comamonadaceae bacterium CG12_big_fil_rev_8_21_14_0_65_59_15]|nr:MAG: prevent-host-death family protein [Comamonadaceae bacterium CG12_big_fil_rev_8_21_14_0_65_59_15]
MKTVAVFEAKNRFSELVVAAEQGEDITITRHGLPVARLVSISVPTAVQRQQKQRVSDVMLRLRQLGAQSTLGCTVQQALGHGRD